MLAPSRPALPLAPAELPGYRLVRLLGGGGFATVWEGRSDDHPGDCALAIKIGNAATAHARARFAREAEVLAQLEATHVPEIYGQGQLEDGRPYLIEERLQGQSLAALLSNLADPPAVHWIRNTFAAVLTSLEAIHARGIVHADLKPEHVFFGPGGPGGPGGHVGAEAGGPTSVRFIDFGLVEVDTGAEDAGTAAGTAEYMAPEQLDGRVSTRADIYAAGVILYEMLTLRVPFAGSRAEIQYGHRALRPAPPGTLASVPDALAAVCLACLSKNPKDRPEDVRALRARFEAAYAEAQAVPEIAQHTGTRPNTSDSRSQRVLLGSGSQLVVLLVAEVENDDGRVDAIVAEHHGLVTRQQGTRYVCGFSGVDQSQPTENALAAAQALLTAYRARVALHLARLTVRRGRRAARFYGAEVETPEQWLPAQPWRELVLSPAFANALPAAAVEPSTESPGFYRPSERPAEEQGQLAADPDIELIGQSAVLAEARACVDATRVNASPGLFTIYGDNGLGKSRLARELAERMQQWWPEARVSVSRAQRMAYDRADPGLHEQLARLAPRTAPAEGSGPQLSAASGVATDGAQGLAEALRAAAQAAPLVVVLDDAHHAESTLLDAIEYATLDGEDMPLWIVVCAHPQMLRRRPHWGERALRHKEVELAPLSEPDAMDMTAALLRPAEYTPAAALRQLAQWAGGNPQVLHALVQRLKRDGIVRQHTRGASWYLDTAKLTGLPASPAAQWLVTRTLEALLPELSACLQLCAVLGSEFTREELAWVQDEMLRIGAASTSLDPAFGLAELERRGFVAPLQEGGWAFQQAAFQEAVYVLVEPEDRVRIHEAALAFWRTQPQDREHVLEALARHAMAVGARDRAADAYRTLGDRARAQHRDVDAEQHYSMALPFVADDDHERRVHLLGARGQVRYRLQRCGESEADLIAAGEHARALGDARLHARLLLELATALDWAERFSESAHKNEEAGALIAQIGDPALAARHTAALGRTMFRKGQMHEASEYLARADAMAAACGDRECRVLALLLLGPSLVCINRLPAAEQAFEQVITLCEEEGDRLHLCAAYSNRSFLWSAKRSLSGLISDLRRTLELARELGQPMAERVAAHNLAEYLHWNGKSNRALSLARRALALQRFLPAPVPSDALLLARIHAARGERAQAHSVLASARALWQSASPSRSEEIAMRMLDLFLGDQHGAREWNELVAAAGAELPGEELLELYYFRACAAASARRWQDAARVVTDARTLLVEYPVWQEPFAELAQRVQANGPC